MLSYILSAFHKSPDSSFSLEESELPCKAGDTSYAVQVRLSLAERGVKSLFVILSDGVVGVEALVGSSRWYCIPDRNRVLARHQIGREIKYRGDGETWTCCESVETTSHLAK